MSTPSRDTDLPRGLVRDEPGTNEPGGPPTRPHHDDGPGSSEPGTERGVERCDVVVVGAGLAGLTAAQFLRRAGRRAIVLDPAPPGGRGRSDVRDDAVWNRGPHALYLGGAAEAALRELGVAWRGAPAGRLHLARAGQVGLAPTGAGSLVRTPFLGARGRLATAALFARLPRLDATALAGRTVGDWVGSLDLPADAAALLHAIVRISTYANAPDLADAGMVVAQVQQALGRGVRYLDGGWRTLVDQLSDGLDIRRAAATSVRRECGQVVVETTGATVIAAAAVVAVATPDAAAALLGVEPYAAGPPVEAACLDLITARHASTPVLLGLDEPLYLSDHGLVARLAPAGRTVVHVARYLEPCSSGRAGCDPATTRAGLERQTALAGIADGDVVDARYLHRMVVSGALAVAAHGGLRGRPEVSGVDGVLLAGDWVGPDGHLLDAAMASARRAAERADRLVAR